MSIPSVMFVVSVFLVELSKCRTKKIKRGSLFSSCQKSGLPGFSYITSLGSREE